ncbi:MULTISPECIES: hypothetical protein [unclassified Mycobacterium]|uniref:hypothetical protein n=1 Tax=unclassified Mycobacterium TaxID=2642494 RepID=UPI0027416FE7|nr:MULTISPECIES: hypothetical protein [unclassified Mycobacterium]MDP7704015.1 hypothetical protein [Mycobacterium sp. TY815]MDP7722499.1 hypothetical protein [Mycobacterium sp. TY814]
MTLRVLVTATLAAAFCMAGVPRATAAPGCPAGGTPPPPGAATRQIGDVDGDGLPDTLWVGKWQGPEGAMTRAVGIATASGADSDVPIVSASPIPLRALAIDVQNGHQVIASLGRSAPLYTFAECRLQTVVDSHYGRPFVFDLENLAGNGTGVGCGDFGGERHLVALQALDSGGRWTVRRTEIDLNGLWAATGASDTLTAASAHDPVVTTAQTISCGERTIDQDGVQEP